MMRKKTIQHLAGLSFVLMCSASAVAAPIEYSEASSGDLNNFTDVGTLDVGANTVQGRFCRDESTTSDVCPGGQDLDSFDFILPAGLTIDSIALAFATTPSTSPAQAGIALLHGSEFETTVDLTGAGTAFPFSPSGMLPASDPGIYGIGHNFLTAGTYSVVYTWTIQVSEPSVAVPEPTTAALLGLGLLGLGFSRRKRATK